MSNVNHYKPIFFTISLFILSSLALYSCGTDAHESVLKDQNGTLVWGGSPALDGLGMLFETADTTYGVPGNREDFSTLFPDSENRIEVIADVKLTGENTARGWLVTFPKVELKNIRPAE
ncbi:MAG: hypothetical protein JJU46_13150 [Balneolaceae bacterium]|nr:hypothetical protein [Balneolaceae bacterium]MCH8548750.1 hypothetical protein [Balneolaceae bacterium]